MRLSAKDRLIIGEISSALQIVGLFRKVQRTLFKAGLKPCVQRANLHEQEALLLMIPFFPASGNVRWLKLPGRERNLNGVIRIELDFSI